MTHDITLVITLMTGIAGIIFGMIGFLRGRRADNLTDGRHTGTVLTELGYIKSGIDDIKHRQDRQEERHAMIIERLSVVEESLHQAHHRIDALEG